MICDRVALASCGERVLLYWPKDKNGKVITKTHQSFAKDADINNIMAKYAVSGVLVDPLNVDSGRVARFGDFSDLADYPTMVQRIQQAQNDFMTLPSAVRAKFENSVEQCLNFISEPVNVVESVKLGLLPESMIDATFIARPDLATPEWIALRKAKMEDEAKPNPSAPIAPNDPSLPGK